MVISSEAPSAATVGYTPIDATPATAGEGNHKLFARDVPFGAQGESLDQDARAWQVMDQAKLTTVQRLAPLDSCGALLERGGSSTVDNNQLLCSTHNRLKHHLQVALSAGSGKTGPG